MSTVIHRDPVSGAPWRFVNGALDASGQAPRLAIVPTVSAAPQASAQFGDGTGDVRYLRFKVNAGDAVFARDHLKAGFPDVGMMIPGKVYEIEADAAIERLDIVAIGDAETGSLSTPGQLVVDAAGSTAIEYGTAMVSFEFASADDVRRVLVTLSDRYSATAAPATSANYVRAHVEGRSYGT